MSTRSFLLPGPLADYVSQNWVDEPEILLELRNETSSMPNAGMQISADQGQLFTVLLKAIGAKKTLEIGVFTGYSSTATALALPAEGRVIACDISEDFTAMAKRYWQKAGVAHKIELRIAPALETLGKIREGDFDFVFIDADKPNYWNYLEACLPLLRPGALIAVDNVLWSGKVADPENDEEGTIALRDFNARLHRDPRVIASLAPIGDGLTLAVKL